MIRLVFLLDRYLKKMIYKFSRETKPYFMYARVAGAQSSKLFQLVLSVSLGLLLYQVHFFLKSVWLGD